MFRQICLIFRRRWLGVVLRCFAAVVFIVVLFAWYDRNDIKCSNLNPEEDEGGNDIKLLRTNNCWGKALEKRWQRFYNESTCKDNPGRLEILKLLTFWVDFSARYNMSYALMWGSLLGLVRVNDVLPWDHDIDIIIDYKDMTRLKEIVEKPGTFDIDDGNVHIFMLPEALSQHNRSVESRTQQSCTGKVGIPERWNSGFQHQLFRGFRILLHGAIRKVFYGI